MDSGLLISRLKYAFIIIVFSTAVLSILTPISASGIASNDSGQQLGPDLVTTTDGDVGVVRSNGDELVFEISPPQMVRTGVDTGDGRLDRIRIPGYGYLGLSGKPDLPQKAVVVALPPGAQPEITLLGASHHQVDNVRVLPAANQELKNDPSRLLDDIAGFVPEFETSYPVDSDFYGDNDLFPENPVALGEVFWLRDQRVVRVNVRPILANSQEESLTVYSYLQVQVKFLRPSLQFDSVENSRIEGPVFESILRDTILNYAEGREWRTPRPTVSVPKISPCMDVNAYRISVDRTEMYQISFGDLSALGWPNGVDNDDIRMCYEDHEISIRVKDQNGNGKFNSSDLMIFYGQAIKTQETATNIYWLTYTDGSAGQRMGDGNNSPGGPAPAYYTSTIHLENDDVYFSNMPMSDANDHWYWQEPLIAIPGHSGQSLTADFDLDYPVTSGVFRLRIQMWGYFRPEWHKVEVRLNNHSLGEVNFFGSAINNVSYLYEADVPSQYLNSNSGANSVSIVALPHSSNPSLYPHIILVDWIELEPRRMLKAENNQLAFDVNATGIQNLSIEVDGFQPINAEVDVYEVTDPSNPTWQSVNASGGSLSFNRTVSNSGAFELTSFDSLLNPASLDRDSLPSPWLTNVSNQADMIMITDRSLRNALAPLRQHRQAQGTVVKTVYVQDIFDEFSYGRYSTEAIRDFLMYAYTHWSGDRSYVLLAGEGSYDHRDVLGLNGPGGNLVPVYLRSGIDNSLGEAASDNQYVEFDGDDLADMLLGRLPARNSAELTVMVDKIRSYETGPNGELWRAKHLFVSDNGIRYFANIQGCDYDPAGDFFKSVNNFISDYFPNNHLLRRLYFAPTADGCYPNDTYPVMEAYYATTVFQMQTGLVQQYNYGNQFVIFTGHSGTQTWGHEGLFNLAMANGVSNGSRTPIMLPMTCLTGIYHFPQGDNLSETLLKSDIGGSVASYAPTGLQVQSGHDYLLKGFYSGVFDDGDRILGQAVYKAKLNLDSGPTAFHDLHDTFMLLGDPAMRIDMPDLLKSYIPMTSH